MLVKQDSAYVEREDLGSFIRKSGYDQKISSDYSTLDSGEGRAAEFQIYGPPKPICNEERLANIDELGCMEKAAGDPQIREPPVMHFRTKPSFWKLSERLFLADSRVEANLHASFGSRSKPKFLYKQAFLKSRLLVSHKRRQMQGCSTYLFPPYLDAVSLNAFEPLLQYQLHEVNRMFWKETAENLSWNTVRREGNRRWRIISDWSA